MKAGWRETPASRHSELRGGDRKEARKAQIVKGGRETPRDRNEGSHLHTFTKHRSKFSCKYRSCFFPKGRTGVQEAETESMMKYI